MEGPGDRVPCVIVGVMLRWGVGWPREMRHGVASH